MPGLHDAIVPFRNDDNIGIGIDSASGDRRSLVVNPVTGKPQGARGSTSVFNITRIFQTSELETALNIDADASAGIASFAGVSARFNFGKQMKVQNSSLFMVVTAFVQLASESIEAPTIADTPPGAGASSMVDNPKVFLQRYGDMFVRSFQRGGFFVGVLQINTASSSEAEQVAASLEGAYDLISGDASTKLQTVASKYQSQLFVHQYSEGGVILQIDDQHNPLQLLSSVGAFLKSFQDQPEDVAAAFNCSLAPVAIAAGPLPPNEADREHARDVIVECAKRRSATMDQLNLVQFISDHNSDYDFSNCAMGTITKAIVGFQSDLDIIAGCASEAINHTSAQAEMPPQYAASRTPPVTYPTALPNPLPTRTPGAPNTTVDGIWRPDDNSFDVSQLDIVSTGPGQADVVVTFRHGQNAPIVKQTTATLDVGANMYRTPEIIKQVFEIPVDPDDPGGDFMDQNDLQKVAFSNAIVDNKINVIQTVVGQVNVPAPVSEENLDTMFTRQLRG